MRGNRTESQRVQQELREAILEGAVAPGERLPQRKLAERFETTTIVVRDAFRALESEGLVEIEAKWGARVTEISPARLRERYIVREALEGMAARLAAKEMGARERDDLETLARRVDTVHRDPEASRQDKAVVHNEMHEMIVEASRCQELIDLVRRFNLQTIIVSNAYHIDWNAEEADWHARLAAAIVSGDGERAESEMRAHVRRGLEMETTAITTES